MSSLLCWMVEMSKNKMLNIDVIVDSSAFVARMSRRAKLTINVTHARCLGIVSAFLLRPGSTGYEIFKMWDTFFLAH